jgi:hypothetical protein
VAIRSAVVLIAARCSRWPRGKGAVQPVDDVEVGIEVVGKSLGGGRAVAFDRATEDVTASMAVRAQLALAHRGGHGGPAGLLGPFDCAVHQSLRSDRSES